MTSVRTSERLARDILRLRRAERNAEVVDDVAPVRAELERQLGPTLSRSRAARILGVSQTALDRWLAAGAIPTVLTPRGRRAVPRQAVVELAERVAELRVAGASHPLATALRERREQAERTTAGIAGRRSSARMAPDRHRTAERRSLAYHRLIAQRLTPSVIADARDRIDQLERLGQIHPEATRRWRDILARDPDEIARAIGRDTPEWRHLRQSTPFAGIATEQERRLITEHVR